MFRIKGKSISARVATSRTGVRSRRLPSIVLSSGAVIKIHPNRHVFVTENDLKENYARLLLIADQIVVSSNTPPFLELDLLNLFKSEPEPLSIVEEEPAEVAPIVEEPVPVIEVETVPVQQVEPEQVVEEPTIEVEPEPVQAEPEPPAPKKAKRKRRTKAEIAADRAKGKSK